MGAYFLKILYRIRLTINGIVLLIFGLKARGVPQIDNQWRIYGIRNIEVGKNFKSGLSMRLQNIDFDSTIKIGDNVNFNDRVHIASKISVIIGNGCLFASNVLITDHGHGLGNLNMEPIKRKLEAEPVVIGNNVWIGENCTIYKGVQIGDGAIIGANSFVNKSVPKQTIFAGSPAKKIKK